MPGVDPWAVSGMGTTMLDIADRNGCTEVVILLSRALKGQSVRLDATTQGHRQACPFIIEPLTGTPYLAFASGH